MNILDVFKIGVDPLKECVTYKELGCCHVDGFLCNPETCEGFKEVIDEEEGDCNK